MESMFGSRLGTLLAALALAGCGGATDARDASEGDGGRDAVVARDAATDAASPRDDADDGGAMDGAAGEDAMDDARADVQSDARGDGGACVSDKLVPTCGGAWWGVYEATQSGESVAAAFTRIETQVGRRFDIAHYYHANNQTFPNATERQWSDEGHLLLINWKPSNAVNGWAIAAGGSIDATIAQAAVNVRTFGRPLFLALYHEPENNLPGGSDTQAGTAADYVAMWRHVRQVFDQNHATNVVWVWDMMGFSGHAAHYLSGDLYPGDAYVDWIAYDPYNFHDTSHGWESFEQATNDGASSTWPGFYTWATTTHPDKPLMLAEYGTYENTADADAKAQWFLDELTALRTTRTAIRALVYFDAVGIGDTTLETSAASVRAFATIGHDPYLNPPHH